MDRKAIWTVWLLSLLINLSALAGASPSESSPLFEKELSVSSWHIHLSHHRFPAPGDVGATLKLTKLASAGAVKDGLVTLNGRFIALKSFLTSVESVTAIPVALTGENRLIVFLWGSPGDALRLEIFIETPPVAAPRIVSFEAEPPTVRRGQSSLLRWQTEHAERCEIQPGIGSVEPSGSLEAFPTETAHYTLTAYGQGDPASSALTIAIENSGPVALAQNVATDEDLPVVITLTAHDVDGDALFFQIVSGPVNGTLSGAAPDLIYSPNSNFAGPDTFSFTVSDGRITSAAAPVTLTVQAVNDPPTADAGPDRAVWVGEWVTLDGHLSNDTDGDPLTYVWTMTSQPAGSSAALTNSMSVNAAFMPDKAGPYQVQLRVHDGLFQSDPAFVEIVANPRMAIVPEVAGLALSTARALITGAYLAVGPVAESHHEIVAAGHVVSQAPAGGALVEEGSAISLVVSLGPLQQLPVVTLQALPPLIAKGSATVLSWTTAYAQRVHIDPGVGEVATSGSVQVVAGHSSTYTLTAVGYHGTTNATATVQVTMPPAPQPEGSFGKFYEDLIPPDAALEQHDPRRFALITGVVLNAQGQPLPSVSVTIHGHPQYGTASSDDDGRFSLPVEGGGTLMVLYRKPGLMAAQRQVYVAWNDTAVADTIQMVAADAAATTVTFDGSAGSVKVHRSTPVTDAYGERTCTVVLAGDNKAYLADKGGNKVLELPTINVRATEYRTPEAMPAKLPPSSAFTWCAEFSVDGAERVQFEKPVIIWVDNFLGFPVGEVVPVGYYDRDRAQWLPMKNGVVAMLLDTDGDGRVDGLDADGDGQPDDLDQNGSTANEVLGLTNNQLYAAGATYWRAAVTHFSPIDLNWPFGLPPDATPPNPTGQAVADQQREAGKDPRQCLGSFLEEKSRIFHEDIPIPGTDLRLHYASSRTAGYKPGVITVPVSGETVPDGLVRIVVKAEVAGREYEVSLPPVPNQVARIEWDGLDYLGRPVSGTVVAHIRIGFVYYGVYYRAASIGDAFAQPGLRSLLIPTRRETTAWKSVDIPIIRAIGTLAEGWSLSAHHYVSPMDASRIFKGDGTIGANNAAVIETVAGDGTWARVFGGMGGPAVKAQIGEPYGVVTDAEGNLYIGSAVLIPYSHWQHRILKVDRKGIATIEKNFAPASTTGFARDAHGNYYHSSTDHNCIYKIDRQNAITTYGLCNMNYGGGFSGDGGPATAARFSVPAGIDVDSGGNVYIADRSNHRVRKIDPNGTITTLAGTGAAASSGDGGPATAAALYYPVSVAVDSQGNLFIAEEYSRRVRKVDASGTITTVAGNGTSVFKGDGWRATETGFYDIRRVAVDRKGNLYIVSGTGNRVYKVDAGGIVTTVAGSGPIGYGQGGFDGEGGAATAARLDYPAAVAVGPAGDVYIADQFNERVRRVGPPSARLAALMDQSDLAFTEENGLGYILSAAGRHKMTIDLETGAILREFLYDTEGRLTTIVDAFDNRVVIERGAGGVPTAIVSPDGLRTGLSINGSNQLTGIIYPDGSVTAFNYTLDSLELRKVQPAGNTFGHAYDGQGRLTDYTDDEGGHWQLTQRRIENGDIRHETLTAEGGLTTHADRYDSAGTYQSVVTDAAGAQTVLVESADGLTAGSTLACGLNREYLYDIDSHFKFKFIKQLTEQSGPTLRRVTGFQRTYTDTDADQVPDLISSNVTVNGRTVTLSHDIVGARKTFISAGGRSVVVSYDPNTLLSERIQAPGFLDRTYDYDNRGRLTTATVGSRSTAFGYNHQGFLASVTDPLGRQTLYAYDPVGRTRGITRPDGSLIGFEYDANGNMTVLVNPAEVPHRFGHNRVNAASDYTAPVSGTYQYRYDRDRRPTEAVLPSGRTVRNVYDRGLLARTETAEGTIYFNYLCGSKLGLVSKGGEGIAYAYEGILLSSETSSGTLNQAATYSYGNDFELIQAAYAGESTGFGYDNDGLLTQAGPFAIVRDAASGLPLEVSGTGLQINRAFNGYGEVQGQAVAVAGSPVASYSLLRDNAGNILRKNEVVGGAVAVYEYGYDAAGRLLRVSKDGVSVEEYQYDETGARTYEKNTRRGIAGRLYSYSDEDHLLGAGDWAYQYDLDGFLTDKTSSTIPTNKTQYSYSSRGELLAVALPDGKLVEYICDPLGRRIAKRVNGAVTEKYLWQGMSRLLAVYDGAGSLRMRFEYADDRMPVAMTAGGVRYYFGYDQVGSLIALADGSGRVVKRVSYDSFGNVLEDSNPAVVVPFGFAGGLHDRDTGLVRFGFRDYDPEVGRWTAKDPIGFAGGDTDLYGYVQGNPINFIDPWGFFESHPFLQAVIPGQALFDHGVTAIENGNYALAGFYFSGMVGEQAIFALTLGKSLAAKGATACGPGVASGAQTTVIGKLKDLNKLSKGENTLLNYLPDRGGPKANWKQNSGVLRQEMAKGQPIRDASVDSVTGDLINYPGSFLNAERNLLRNGGWTYDPTTTLWSPP
jgi:RHS repeat-associated protein